MLRKSGHRFHFRGRIVVGAEGWDKQTNGPGYIQSEYDHKQLEALRDHLNRILESA